MNSKEQDSDVPTHIFSLALQQARDHTHTLIEHARKHNDPSALSHGLLYLCDAATLVALITEDEQHLDEAVRAAQECESVALSNCQCGRGWLSSLKKGLMSWKKHPNITEQPSHYCIDSCVVHSRAVMWKALLNFRRGNYATGAAQLRSAWKLLSKLDTDERRHSLSPQAASGLLTGMGAFHFFISLVPPAFRWILEMLGFEGDRQRGIEELYQATQLRDTPAPQAWLLLLWIESSYHEDAVKGEEVYAHVQQHFPQGALFHYLAGYLSRQKGAVQEAIGRFQRAHDCAEEIPQLQLMCRYELGWCHFLLCDFTAAIEHLRHFLTHFQSPSFRAFAAFQCGTSLALTGNDDGAVEMMQRVPALARKHFSFDAHAKRMAKQFLERGALSPFQEHMTLATNHIAARNHTQAHQELQQAAQQLQERQSDATSFVGDGKVCKSWPTGMTDDHAWWHYLSGRLCRGNEDDDQAKRHFEEVLSCESRIKRETYLVPHALVELGELFQQCPVDVQRAKKCLKKAKSYCRFDFDKVVFRRVMLNLDRIRARVRD